MKRTIRWIVESVAMVVFLVAVFYGGYIEGAKTINTCVLPIGGGNSLELRKVP